MKKLITALAIVATFGASASDWQYLEVEKDVSQIAFSNDLLIAIDCSGALFNFGQFMGLRDTFAFIEIKVDDNKEIESSYAIGEWDGDKVNFAHYELEKRGIIDQMKAGTKIKFRAKSLNKKRVTKEVSLLGFTKAYNQLECEL